MQIIDIKSYSLFRTNILIDIDLLAIKLHNNKKNPSLLTDSLYMELRSN